MKIMRSILNGFIGGIIGYFVGLLIYFVIACMIDFTGIYTVSQHDMYFNACLILSRLGILCGMIIFETKVRLF